MKFAWDPDLSTGGAELTAQPGDYDGHPRPGVLRLDYSPRFRSPGRLAVAAVLAFRPFIAGALTFPQPISPELAQGIRAFLDPVAVFPEPLEFHPKKLPSGGVTVAVEAGGNHSPDGPPPDPGMTRLRITSAAADAGHHFEQETFTVPTNAALLVPSGGEPLDRLMPYLAAAVLVAEDFGVGTLRLPETMAKGRRYRQLLEMLKATGLALWSEGDPKHS